MPDVSGFSIDQRVMTPRGAGTVVDYLNDRWTRRKYVVVALDVGGRAAFRPDELEPVRR